MRNGNKNIRYDIPSLDTLPTFEAAARLLSFTEAGSELFITQSAVSKQLRRLEDQLGVKLFDRRARALQLTDAGLVLQRRVTDILDQLQIATDELRQSAYSNEIAVTVPTSFASLWLIPRLERFTSRHPEIDVRIVATSAVLDLDRARLDLAIRICAPSAAPPESVRLFEAQAVVICSPRLMNDDRRPLRGPQDIVHHTLLKCAVPEFRGTQMDWDAWLLTAGIGELKPAASMTFNHVDQVIQAAIAGHGVALGQSRLVSEMVRAGQLATPFSSGSPGQAAYVLIRAGGGAPRAASHLARVDAFVDWLIQEASVTNTSHPATPGSSRVPRRGTTAAV